MVGGDLGVDLGLVDGARTSELRMMACFDTV